MACGMSGLPSRQEPTPPDVVSQAYLEAAAELTSNERQLVEHVLAGKSIAKAHELAYPAQAGNLRNKANAYHVAAKPRVQKAIQLGRQLGLAGAIQDRDAWLARCIQREEQSAAASQFTAAARFFEVQGRAMGWLGSGDTGDGQGVLAPDELIISIRARFGAEAAQKAALSMGVLDYSRDDGKLLEGECTDITPSAAPVTAESRAPALRKAKTTGGDAVWSPGDID